MDNFIPKAFTQEKDECPVCLARLDLEATLPLVAKSLDKLLVASMQNSVNSDVCRALIDLHGSFAKCHADYRVAFSLNLSIWFSAERFGRVKKVPDLILAYEEYRGEAIKSLSALKAAVQNLQQVCRKGPDKKEEGEAGEEGLSDKGESCAATSELPEFLKVFSDFQEKAERFWLEVDKWTDKRREEAFKVI